MFVMGGVGIFDTVLDSVERLDTRPPPAVGLGDREEEGGGCGAPSEHRKITRWSYGRRLSVWPSIAVGNAEAITSEVYVAAVACVHPDNFAPVSRCCCGGCIQQLHSASSWNRLRCCTTFNRSGALEHSKDPRAAAQAEP